MTIWLCPAIFAHQNVVLLTTWLDKKPNSVMQIQPEKYDKTHLETIMAYMKNLETGNVEGMLSLFNCGAMVASSGSGIVKAEGFYSGFLPTIKTGRAEIQHIYSDIKNPYRYSASFHLCLEFNDGSQLKATYVDEFEFSEFNNKLLSVYMYENTKI
ncbi:MAG: hypothetical protein OXE99_08165 [Cellvibrionales bacterium]|nr:hypothetical protein [Cellvibrionales bacterium]